MSRASVVVGIDVSKAALDVAVRPSGTAWRTGNDAAGITALVAELAAPERLTTAIAIHSTANLMTNALGPALGEPALERYGPGLVFGAAGVMAVLSAVLVRRIGPGAAARKAP